MFSSELDLRLPRHRTALLFCDPIWYAGRTVPVDVISQIAEWQKATGSFVIVDGSFQYMQWDRTRAELAATLDPELTFRLVSPAKSLAIPCFRFAYLLHPATIHEEFLFLYENLVGGSCITDLHFAARSLAVLRSQSSNLALTDYLRSRYDTLISSGYLETEIQPNSGYFVFGLPREHRPDEVYMDQEFFELQGYQNYGRINLLKTIL